jgi:uncharacterized membrane protein HdeD (DUF308 family)
MTIVARRWWTVALRGLAAIILGVLAIFLPGLTFLSLVILFGVYAIVDGVLSMTIGLRGGDEPQWASIIGRGLVSVVAGVLALAWPGITGLVLLMVIATWAIISGVLEIVAAIRLRKEIEHEWMLGLTGALAVAFGILLFISPAAGAVALGIWVGAYALMLGVVLVGASLSLRKHQKGMERRHVEPPPGAYAPA